MKYKHWETIKITDIDRKQFAEPEFDADVYLYRVNFDYQEEPYFFLSTDEMDEYELPFSGVEDFSELSLDSIQMADDDTIGKMFLDWIMNDRRNYLQTMWEYYGNGGNDKEALYNMIEAFAEHINSKDELKAKFFDIDSDDWDWKHKKGDCIVYVNFINAKHIERAINHWGAYNYEEPEYDDDL